MSDPYSASTLNLDVGDRVVWLDEPVYEVDKYAGYIPLVYYGCTGVVVSVHDGSPPGADGVETLPWAFVSWCHSLNIEEPPPANATMPWCLSSRPQISSTSVLKERPVA